MSTTKDQLLADEAPITEIDEFRALIEEGNERGFVYLEQITSRLDEVEITKEQVGELHAHLTEHGIDVVGADGKPVAPGGEPMPKRAQANGDGGSNGAGEAPRKPEIDLTVEPSLRLAAPVPALDRQGRAAHGRRGGHAGQAHRAR